MKWGHRKAQRGGLPSARKLKRQIKKANKNPDNNKNTIAVSKKVGNKALNSKEGKAYQNVIKNLASFEKAAKAKGGTMVYTKEQADFINKTQNDFNNKYQSIAKKHIDQYAGAMLKDLGYKDTKAGREYLKKKNLV